jgi:hypothetical protein
MATKKTTKKEDSETTDVVETPATEVEAKKKSSKKEEVMTEEKKTETREEKLAKLKARAAELSASKVKDIEKVDIKEKVTGEQSEPSNTLVPIEDYLKASMHLGTRVITPHMRPFVYKRRADGLAVFNTAMLDTMMREAIEYLAQYAPEDVRQVFARLRRNIQQEF